MDRYDQHIRWVVAATSSIAVSNAAFNAALRPRTACYMCGKPPARGVFECFLECLLETHQILHDPHLCVIATKRAWRSLSTTRSLVGNLWVIPASPDPPGRLAPGYHRRLSFADNRRLAFADVRRGRRRTKVGCECGPALY